MPNVVFVAPFSMATTLRFIRSVAALPGVRLALVHPPVAGMLQHPQAPAPRLLGVDEELIRLSTPGQPAGHHAERVGVLGLRLVVHDQHGDVELLGESAQVWHRADRHDVVEIDADPHAAYGSG